MTPIIVRPATETDLSALVKLYAQLSRKENPVVTEVQVAVWRDMQKQPHIVLVVAELGGAVVGTLQLALIAGLRNEGRPFGVIESVVVSEKARRQGIARALLAEAEDRARAANAYKLMLMTAPQREAAVATYRAAGFDGESKVGFEKVL